MLQRSAPKQRLPGLRAEHDFHTNYFHSVQDVSRRISSQSFTRGFDSLHTFYGFEVHGYHHFRTKKKLTGKVMASLEELETVMFTLFVLCFFAFKFACLDFFSFTPLGNIVENLIAYPVSFKYCQSPRFIY